MSNELQNAKILVVDDEPSIRDILAAALEMQGARVECRSDGVAGLEAVRDQTFDLVISDIQMPKLDGMEFLAKVKEEQPWLEFLLITAHGSTAQVVQAMKLGAGDFVNKPFDLGQIRAVVAGLLARRGRRAETNESVAGADRSVGQSPAYTQARSMALKAARADSSVLITGESGTGKEVMARFIHASSARAAAPFIPVNCGAIPESLMESELFGYEKGAFTGALQEKPGKIELAAAGTLFLDEIGEMPMTLQVKLLRVLQERVVDRLGARQSRAVDFRLVTATHRDLPAAIKNGSFREDLYYRLNVIPVHLPPLRDRGDDVGTLAHYFLSKYNQRLGTCYTLDALHIEELHGYGWPGNIRELENILERSVVLSEGARLQLFLPQYRETLSDASGLPAARQAAERATIVQALEKCGGNKSHAAKELGISRRSLLYKVKALGIDD
jgi:two-component system, NtrC family, response regulator AtoC